MFVVDNFSDDVLFSLIVWVANFLEDLHHQCQKTEEENSLILSYTNQAIQGRIGLVEEGASQSYFYTWFELII
jgi:hypothetical protein